MRPTRAFLAPPKRVLESSLTNKKASSGTLVRLAFGGIKQGIVLGQLKLACLDQVLSEECSIFHENDHCLLVCRKDLKPQINNSWKASNLMSKDHYFVHIVLEEEVL